MPMAAEVVAQVHRLSRRGKANKTLTFTDKRDEDLDVLYTSIPQAGDDVAPSRHMTSSQECTEKKNKAHMTTTTIQNKTMTRTQKTRTTLTALTTMMTELTHQEYKSRMMVPMSTHRPKMMSKPQEWMKKSQDWRKQNKFQEWMVSRKPQELTMKPLRMERHQTRLWFRKKSQNVRLVE